MQYQTFRGQDVREAVTRIRKALGPNAVIGATRQVSNGRGGAFGQSFVEVMAARPTDPAESWTFAPPTTNLATPEPSGLPQTTPPRGHALHPRPLSAKKKGTSSKSDKARDDAQDIDQELRTLRTMLEELNASRPPREKASAMLLSMGFETRMVKELASSLGRSVPRTRDALRQALGARIIDRLRVGSNPLALPHKQLIVCVGPTGAGKTTTLAKLAARARLDHGRTVGVISLDTFRVGALEQWQRYAQLMGVAFGAAREVAELERAVERSSCDVMLVDTTGRGPAEAGQPWPLMDALSRVTRYQSHVLAVLPAWLRASDAQNVLFAFADVGPTGVIVTKIDETRRLGGVLDAVMGAELPVNYLCNGPRVPEDISEASADRLVSELLTGTE